MKSSTPSGWLAIDKPLHMSSFDVIRKLRKILNIKKIGHAGTLDPLASGVLLVAVGQATKLIEYAMASQKGYEFTIAFGESRSTGDAEGEVVATTARIPSEVDLISVLSKFIGITKQTPPAYSAIKVNGKRAYDLARKGEEVKLEARDIIIHKLELISFQNNEATLYADCGKGTYIRSLACDISVELGSLGYVSMLRRKKIGNFTEDDTILLENLEKLVHNNKVLEVLLPLAAVLDDIPAVAVSPEMAEKLRFGQCIANNDNINSDVAYVTSDNDFIGLVKVLDNELKPFRIFNN
jgi:tRNA pseudouridine55 synthase